MYASDPTATTAVELSRAEQWVLHHVLLNSLRRDDERRYAKDGWMEFHLGPEVIEKLETGVFEFTQAELKIIRQECEFHARTTEAVADRNLASAVVTRINTTLERGALDGKHRGQVGGPD